MTAASQRLESTEAKARLTVRHEAAAPAPRPRRSEAAALVQPAYCPPAARAPFRLSSSPSQWHTLVALLLSLICLHALVPTARAHTIDILPARRECFFEELSHEDKMTVTYQVASGGELDIDFWITDPNHSPLYSLNKKDTGTFSFTAQSDGRYTYCFSNEMSSVTGKTVSFNVHGVMYVEDDGHTAPIEKEIRALSAALEAVKDEQEYIVTRERLHRDTAESTNDRVKWWSIIQTVLVVVVCAWQVYYLRRFFEVKR